MAGNHLSKVESALYKEISMILQRDLDNPKLGFVTVSEVKVSSDLAHAKIYVSFLGKDARNEAGLKVLNASKGRIRSLCAKNLPFHKIPQLDFVIDEQLKKAQKIDDLLIKIQQEEE